jgi:hypothetical protein
MAEFRHKYQEYLAERSAARSVRLAKPQSEAEWFYYQGLRLYRRGEEREARRVWQGLVEAFRSVPAERPWVRKAEEELLQGTPGPRESEQQWRALREALRAVKQLRAEGKADEAQGVENALRRLYRDDTGARAIVEEGAKE